MRVGGVIVCLRVFEGVCVCQNYNDFIGIHI